LIVLAAHSFPPQLPLWKYWTILGAVLLILAIQVFALFLRSRKTPRSRDLVFWVLSVPFTSLVIRQGASLSGGMPVESRQATTLDAWLVAIAFIAFAGFVVTLVRVSTRDTRPRVGFAAACLAGALVLMGSWVLALIAAQVVANRTACKNNIHSVATALHKFAERKGSFPEPSIMTGAVPHSWRIETLPWMPLVHAAGYDVAQPWNSPANSAYAVTEGRAYSCPSNPWPRDEQRRFFTAYAAVTGDGTVFSKDMRAQFPKIPDGSSQTLLIVEACGQRIVWTEPRDVDASLSPPRINSDGSEPGRSDGLISSYHAGGAEVAFADGGGRFLNESIDPEVLKALTTADGGEGPQEF
jgi:hypothetical protein